MPVRAIVVSLLFAFSLCPLPLSGYRHDSSAFAASLDQLVDGRQKKQATKLLEVKNAANGIGIPKPEVFMSPKVRGIVCLLLMSHFSTSSFTLVKAGEDNSIMKAGEDLTVPAGEIVNVLENLQSADLESIPKISTQRSPKSQDATLKAHLETFVGVPVNRPMAEEMWKIITEEGPTEPVSVEWTTCPNEILPS